MKKSVYKSDVQKQSFRAVYNGFLGGMPFIKRTVQTPYGETFLLEAGEAANPPVLLLHGSCSNSAFWFGDYHGAHGRLPCFCRGYPRRGGQQL